MIKTWLELTDRRATNRMKYFDCITLFHFKLKKRTSFTHCVTSNLHATMYTWKIPSYIWAQLLVIFGKLPGKNYCQEYNIITVVYNTPAIASSSISAPCSSGTKIE